jgi:hypothetical protein
VGVALVARGDRLVTLWRAGDEATHEQMERVADEVWTWIDMDAEKTLPPSPNGRGPEPWPDEGRRAA